jgi:pyruvate dehydrogenase E2 component (dihydrolipoamide acetyltransferase)
MTVIASPSVRKLAADRGVDIDALAKTLGRETIGREDVLGQTEVRIGAPMPASSEYWNIDHSQWGPVAIQPLNRIALVASANLTAAQQMIPAVTHHDSADVTRLEATREALKAEGTNVTALAFHVAVLARCLKEFPRFNASLSADGRSLVLKGYVHVGIAVDTPHGLAVPVIRDADRLRLSEINSSIRDFAERARARKLRGHEMGGASMTITNLGGIGGKAFTPIVNPPEVAILGITRTELRPVWSGLEFRPIPTTPLDLSYDHRVINGADAARFLARYCDLLAHPDDLLIPDAQES